MDKNSKLWIVIGLAVTVLFCTILAIAGNNMKKNAQLHEDSQMQTCAPSLQPEFTVLLDAGHGGFDAGASGTDTGVREDEINLAVTLLVKDRLEKENICVLLTRKDENALADTKKEDMQKRKEIISNTEADVMVSIHMNKFTDRSVKGPMVFFTDGNTDAQELATAIITSVCEGTNNPIRPANPGDYFVIRVCKVPSCIVECGFLSNRSDEALLCDSTYQNTLASCIANGIIGYLKS